MKKEPNKNRRKFIMNKQPNKNSRKFIMKKEHTEFLKDYENALKSYSVNSQELLNIKQEIEEQTENLILSFEGKQYIDPVSMTTYPTANAEQRKAVINIKTRNLQKEKHKLELEDLMLRSKLEFLRAKKEFLLVPELC
jgi:hypothetical protein